MSVEVTCRCGVLLEASSPDSLLDDAYTHVEIAHPNFPEAVGQSCVVNMMRSASTVVLTTPLPLPTPAPQRT